MSKYLGDDAVTAVIPAYNAEATLDETLRSVRAQTHRALEILVVDDGSRDSTPEIVLEHAAVDPRVRLIRQDNAGVAAARNRAIAEARTALIAPIDADDLWAPCKIEREVAALRRGGAHVALVYSWSLLIDRESHVIGLGSRSTEDGDVLARMCRGNLVGNASAVLMRRDAVLEAGGYDSTLRSRRAQGCEDLLLYCRIAARHHAAVVPDFLTGYRQGEETMSRNAVQMFRSWQLVAAELRSRHPDLHTDIEVGERFAVRWLLGRALWARDLSVAWKLALATDGVPRRQVLIAIAVELASFATMVSKGRIHRLANRLRGRPRQLPALPRQRFPVGALPAASCAQ